MRLLALVVALAACGSARIVTHSPTGGIIELKGDHAKAMEQAIQQMDEHCGSGNFTIKDAEEATTSRVYYGCNTPVGIAPPGSTAVQTPPPP
jgi:hypothetical protein